MSDINRRKFLSAISVGVTTAVAGCSAFPDIGRENETPTGSGAPVRQGGNQTTPEPIERPEDGYIDRKTAEIRWDEIEKDPEYIFAAQESYIIAQDILGIGFDHLEDIFDEFNKNQNNPDFETIEQKHTYTTNATQHAKLLHENCIELLSEHGKEKEALSLIQTNLERTVQGLFTYLENLQTFINKYKEGDRGYVAEHDTEIYQRYEELRDGNIPWRAIESNIKSEYYNPVEQ